MEGGQVSENNGHMQQGGLPVHGLVEPVVFGFAIEVDTVQRAVAMRIECGLGSLVFLMPAKGAKEMGKQLMAGSRNALIGLEVIGDAGDMARVVDEEDGDGRVL